MKLFFRIILKIFLILTILAGCATIEEIKETDSDESLNQGIALLEEGQYDRAITNFNKAIELNPRYADAYYNRGVAYGEKGDWDKAIPDYSKAIEINPKDAEAYDNRGLAYYRKGDYDKACSDWNRACELELCKNYEWAKRKDVCQ
jgi:tetratricopeptide (TPR) repeat protein